MENRVGFWLRVAASLIDVVLLSILAALFVPVAVKLMPGALERAMGEVAKQTAGRPGAEQMVGFMTTMTRFGLSFSLLALPYALIEGLTGASPGKLILGLRVVDESGQRSPIGKLLLRFAIKNSSGILALIGMIAAVGILEKASQWVGFGIIAGFLLVLTRPKQALHDKVAGTAVLRKSDVGATAAAAPTPAATT